MRRHWGVLALACLLLPAALAQLPAQPQPCGPVAMNVLGPASAVAPGERAVVTVSLENGGAADAQVTVNALLSASGWQLLDGDSQTVGIARGQKATLNFTAQASEDAAASAELDLAGQADCAPGALPTACPNPQLCVFQLRAATVTLEIQRPSGIRFPGLDNLGFPAELLLAGIVLIAVAVAIPFAVRRKRPAGPTVATPEPMKRVKPGRGTSFPLEFGNPGPEPVRLALGLSAMPHGWSAMLPMPEIQLAPKETRALWVTVRSPPEARPGDAAEVLLTATDPQGRERSVKLRADVDEGATDQG